MATSGSVVLSTLEFDVLWEAERLPSRHVALDVHSPGKTHAERASLARQAWNDLDRRGLLRRGRVLPEIADRLSLLARPRTSVDTWVWSGGNEVRALAARTVRDAALGVVDGNQVWLVPAWESSLAEAAVSAAGELAAGVGRSVSIPHDVLRAADVEAEGDPQRLVLALGRRGVRDSDAQEIAGMLVGMDVRGQFGVERTTRDHVVHRGRRVVAFHDTDAGRYLCLVQGDESGRDWCTVTPADNRLLATKVWELLDELS